MSSHTSSFELWFCMIGKLVSHTKRAMFVWYKHGKQSIFNLHSSQLKDAGLPRTTITEQTIDTVWAIQNDHYSTYKQIEGTLDIGSSEVNPLSHDYLKLCKVCPRWLSHQLIKDQNQMACTVLLTVPETIWRRSILRLFDIIMIRKQKSNRKCACRKQIHDQSESIGTKSSDEWTVAISSIKSRLIKSIPYEPGSAINVSCYVTICLRQILKTYLNGETFLAFKISFSEWLN